jgi:hypothetical protein
LPRGDVLVVRWVDRLGRNYSDVVDAMWLFIRRGRSLNGASATRLSIAEWAVEVGRRTPA